MDNNSPESLFQPEQEGPHECKFLADVEDQLVLTPRSNCNKPAFKHWLEEDGDSRLQAIDKIQNLKCLEATSVRQQTVQIEDPYRNTYSVIQECLNFSDLTPGGQQDEGKDITEILKNVAPWDLFQEDDPPLLFDNKRDDSLKLKQSLIEATPSTSNSKGLEPGINAHRPDVVNKTIIRSIKRYYWDLFCGGNKIIHFLQKGDGQKWLQNIDEYCLKHFGPEFGISKSDNIYSLKDFLDKNQKKRQVIKKKLNLFQQGCPSLSDSQLLITSWEDQQIFNQAKFYEIKVTFAWILLKIPMKKMFGFPFVKKTYNCFYQVLYSYSVKKLIKLFECQGMISIFKHFDNSGVLEQLMQQDPTLSLNPEIYRQGVQAIRQLCRDD